jgi:hypothetical protein
MLVCGKALQLAEEGLEIQVMALSRSPRGIRARGRIWFRRTIQLAARRRKFDRGDDFHRMEIHGTDRDR